MIPRASGGQSSSAVAAALPYNPPMAIPNKARQARNCLYVWQKPAPSSRTTKRSWLTMNGHLRPHRSEAIPKVIAPTDRSISTRVIPHVMSVTDLSNDFASSEVVRETVKKSNESQDQPRNATYRVRLISQVFFSCPSALRGDRHTEKLSH